MSNYDLDRVGDKEFEHLVQALLKKIIGEGTTTFGDGPDGGREATYSGEASYPSKQESWKGEWIFQVKFHNVRLIGTDKARKEVLTDLKSELEKIVNKYKRKCDNYILATNVPLSSVPGLGTHDKILQSIMPQFVDSIPHIHVWGYDDISRFLDGHPDVRQTYLHLFTPGDLIAELMDRKVRRRSPLAEAVLLYVRTSFEREQYAQLDQAGEIGEKPMPLRRVFIDLNVKLRSEKDLLAISGAKRDVANRLLQLATRETLSATQVLISSDLPRTVLIGGPGQGKSTLGQFIAQIHRAHILQRVYELNGGKHSYVPSIVRLPLRIILKDYAQWIVDNDGPHSLERYIATLMEERAGRHISSEQFQEIIKENPALLILDGLDEVIDRGLRAKMLALLSEFIGRSEDVLNADLQVVATSRPTGYSDQFDPSRFLHLSLLGMNSERVVEYTERWINAKSMEAAKGNSLRASIKDCIADPHFSPLMNTPLQVTIFILIILGGGTPPRQREELFNEYLEVIYKRERAKSKTIIQTEKRLLFGLHQYLGYLLHRRAGGSADTRSRMKEDEFAKEVFNYLRHEDPFSNVTELRQRAEQMISEARKRLVLLVEFDDGSFGFDLRSIQEFFAAGWLTDRASGNRQRFDRFHVIALPSHWRNVALFFAGRIGRSFPGEAALILEACREIDRHKPEVFLKRGTWLALDIAVDRSFGPNRILQRSAIEYALTLLDGDLDHEKRSEFTSRLRRLPKEDINDHVSPLLLQRVQRANLPNGFNTLEVFRSLNEDSSPVQSVITSALEERVVNTRALLDKSLEYGLPPEYVKSTFVQTLSSLSEDQITDLLLPNFHNEPAYVADILRGTSLSNKLARPIFDAALESWRMGISRPPRGIEFSFSPALIDQVKLAWDLVRVIQLAGRDPFLRYFGQSDDLWGFADQYLFRHEDFFHDNPESVEQISRLAFKPTAIIELKATALAFLSNRILSHANERLFEEFTSECLQPENIGEREVAEKTLFMLGALSLETGRSMPELGHSGKRLHVFREKLQEIGQQSEEAGLIYFHVLDSLSDRQLETVAREVTTVKDIYGKISIELVRLIVRLAGSSRRFTGRERPLLASEFVTIAFSQVIDILQRDGADEWRAWPVLSRITSIGWAKQPWRMFPSHNLETVLTRLCDTLEKRIVTISGRWEIGGLLARVAEARGPEHILERLLEIISRMPEGRLCDRNSRATYAWSFKAGTVEKLLKIAMSSDEIVLRGFLKWFSTLATRARPGRQEIEVQLLHFDKRRVESLLESSQGMTREGAIWLLSYNDSLAVNDVSRLLELSKQDQKPIDRAWARLVKNAVQDSVAPDVTSFLENILSVEQKYQDAIKYAALEKYQRTATSIGIQEREPELGLPFQDS